VPQTCPGSVILLGRVRSQRGLVALLVGLALFVGVISGAQAATTWTVCAGGCDYTSIKAAIAAPTTLDGDTLAIAAGTYTEAGITVDKSLTLQGKRAANTIVQAAASRSEATDRVFTIAYDVAVTLQALTIQYGHTGSGGGVYNAGALLLTSSIVRSNKADSIGGGVHNAGLLTLTNSTVSGNEADNNGGGLFNAGWLTLTTSTIRGNTAREWGGGVASAGPNGVLTLTHSTLRDNAANGGGGVYNDQGSLTLTHSTISGNTAREFGGGVASAGPLTLTYSTVSGNTAGSGGGLYSSYYSGPFLANSIIANHPKGGDCATGGLPVVSGGHNLDSDGSCQLTAAGDQPGVDPLLGPLQDNGGPTLTHALLPGSPAIGTIRWGARGCGTTDISDQRWQARPQPAWGACDSGAYEVAVAGQPLSAWLTGMNLHTVVCQNVTTGQEVTLSDPVSPWDCEAAGLAVTSGDQVALRLRGSAKQSFTDVGGAVAGMVPSRGTCTNRTTGQQVTLPYTRGATAASCLAAGLVVRAGEAMQLRVQGVVE
jgi:hypothetical protein